MSDGLDDEPLEACLSYSRGRQYKQDGEHLRGICPPLCVSWRDAERCREVHTRRCVRYAQAPEHALHLLTMTAAALACADHLQVAERQRSEVTEVTLRVQSMPTQNLELLFLEAQQSRISSNRSRAINLPAYNNQMLIIPRTPSSNVL